MKTFRFLDFPVYQDSKKFYLYCIQLTKQFPRQYFELGDQLTRASLSIALNIAEGSAKYSDKDFKRFLENALGSVSECAACSDIAKENNVFSEANYSTSMKELESIAKQLGGLSKKLRSSF